MRYYYHHFGDHEPVEVFIIQESKGLVEINRDPKARAGHWKSKTQLIIK